MPPAGGREPCPCCSPSCSASARRTCRGPSSSGIASPCARQISNRLSAALHQPRRHRPMDFRQAGHAASRHRRPRRREGGEGQRHASVTASSEAAPGPTACRPWPLPAHLSAHDTPSAAERLWHLPIVVHEQAFTTPVLLTRPGQRWPRGTGLRIGPVGGSPWLPVCGGEVHDEGWDARVGAVIGDLTSPRAATNSPHSKPS